MATEKAAAAHEGSAGAGESSGPRLGQLWQVPVFIAGVGLLAYVLTTQLTGPISPARQVERDLHTARQVLDQGEGDLSAGQAAAQRALDAATEEKRGEALFLLGSIHLFLAGKSSGDSAAKDYQLAYKYLEEAERLGVPEADGGKVTYRLGKADYYIGDQPGRVCQRLQNSIDSADDKAEGYAMLCQSYLKLPQPDLANALRANEQLRQVPRAGEEVLAPARLQAGEILLRMGKPEEARKVLEKVGAQAPAAVLVRSCILRARSYQDEKHWAEAAALWQAALKDSRAPASEQAVLRYNLGLCLAKSDQLADRKEACRVWEECLRDSKGDEGPAAALTLAEIRLNEGDLEKGLKLLADVARSVAGPNDWKNSLIPLAAARKTFKNAVDVCRKAHRTVLALQAAVSYERLAAAGEAQALRGQVAAEGARACQDLARTLPGGDKGKLTDEVRALYKQSADAYTKAAEAMGRPAEKAEYLWQAASRAFDAQDAAQASALIEQFLPVNPIPERTGEGWYLLAETRRLLGKESAALAAYRECIKSTTRFAYRAHYHLAMAFIKSGQLDQAEGELEDNLKLIRLDRVNADDEAQEKMLFALGGLFYQRKNYSKVVNRLEEALGRFPANAEATRAHYQLAEAYYILWAQENQRIQRGEYKTEQNKEHARSECRRWLQKATEEYVELSKFLETPQAAGPLTTEEAVQVPFLAAECKFNLGSYEEALQIYEKLADNSNGIDQVNALGGIVRCLAALGRNDKVRLRLDEIRNRLAGMDDSVKAQWKDWLITASKPFAKQ